MIKIMSLMCKFKLFKNKNLINQNKHKIQKRNKPQKPPKRRLVNQLAEIEKEKRENKGKNKSKNSKFISKIC